MVGWGGEQVLSRMVRKDLSEKVWFDSLEKVGGGINHLHD